MKSAWLIKKDRSGGVLWSHPGFLRLGVGYTKGHRVRKDDVWKQFSAASAEIASVFLALWIPLTAWGFLGF